MSAQRGIELGKAAIASDFAEVALGFEDAGCGPAENHSTTLPTPHAAGQIANSAEQVFDEIGRRQHPGEAFRQIQAHDSEGLIQSLAQRGRGAGIFALQRPRQMVEQLPGSFRVSRRIGLVFEICAKTLIIFPLGLSPISGGRGGKMRRRDVGRFKNPSREAAASLRRKARTLSLADDARRGEPSAEAESRWGKDVAAIGRGRLWS